MTIYQKIAIKILSYMKKLENSPEFKQKNPEITIIEYVSKETGLKEKRLYNILSGNAKTRVDEVCKIAECLNVNINKFFDVEILDRKEK